MKHDWTADLLTYWDRLRGTRAAPDRRDISPRALGGKLPNIFILRSDGDGETLPSVSGAGAPHIPPARQWQFRLAGTRLCTLYGRELRNTRFLSLWHDDIRPWLSEQLHLSGLDYRPLRLEHTGITLAEKTCHFETLLLPLHEADGSPAWIGSMVPLEQPLWLGSEPLISNLIGLEPETGSLLPRADAQPATGMKSVLQVLLDRHHELSPQPNPAVTNAERASPPAASGLQARETAPLTTQAGNANIPVADTAFARELLPQLGALMPSARSTPQQATPPAPLPAAASNPAAPLTVADLIRSIHNAAPDTQPVQEQRKSTRLTLITGGKDHS